jgi:RNA polymerase sigma factor (sigma-70 family)
VDDGTISELVLRARSGDQSAWNALVERFAPLVWSVCRRYRLSEADAADAGQSVWLHLLEHLKDVREPAALPGWLATSTARECLRTLRSQEDRLHRERSAGEELLLTTDPPSPDQALLAAERNDAVRAAFARLSLQCRRLLALLAHDPPLSYAEIAERLAAPVGSLGPTRARCLDKLRQQEPLATFIGREARPAGDRR